MIPWWAVILIALGALVAGHAIGWRQHARMLGAIVAEQERERRRWR